MKNRELLVRETLEFLKEAREGRRLHATKTPKLLLELLENRLLKELRQPKGTLAGESLTRDDARTIIAKLQKSSATGRVDIGFALKKITAFLEGPTARKVGTLGEIKVELPESALLSLRVVGPEGILDWCADDEDTPSPTGQGTELIFDQLARLPPEVTKSLTKALHHVVEALDTTFTESHRIGTLFNRHLMKMAGSAVNEALQMCRGNFHTNYYDCSLLTAQVSQLSAGDQLLGLTDWHEDLHWWKTEDGKQFREANLEAISNGAVVRRIFLRPVDETKEEKSKLRLEMESQRKSTIQVGSISLQDVLPFRPADQDVRSSCVMFSAATDAGSLGWLTYSVTGDRNSQTLKNRFSVNELEIREKRNFLEEIWRHAYKRGQRR